METKSIVTTLILATSTLAGCLEANPPDISAFEIFIGKSERTLVARLGQPNSVAASDGERTLTWIQSENVVSRTPDQIYFNGKWITTGYTTNRYTISCAYTAHTKSNIVQSHELIGLERLCRQILPG